MQRSKLRRSAFAMVMLVPLVASVACGSDEALNSGRDPEAFPVLTTMHPATCDGYAARLRACGLLTQGAFGCVDPETEADSCSLGCLTGAACSLLWDYQCRSLPPVIDRCFSLCHAFECGSGELVALEWQCDGENDCLDASDEEGCAMFTCGSGEEVVERYRCNWVRNCLDGSDEDGCVGFDCASGGSIPAEGRCNGSRECLDGSDEKDCPALVCNSTGETLPASWRCDQIYDCLDGSDEVGCAELLCR